MENVVSRDASLGLRIQELKRQVEGLRSERRMILEHCSTAVLLLRDERDEICEGNTEAAALTKYPGRQLIGMCFHHLVQCPVCPEQPSHEADRGNAACYGPVRQGVLTCRDATTTPVRIARCTIHRDGVPFQLVFLYPVEEAWPASQGHPEAAVSDARTDVDVLDVFPNIIGKSERIRKTCKLVGKVAQTDSTVLIQGESGTGKEVFARIIHYHSRRAKGPFVRVNCAALSESLLESELFGHVKGAFTGAVRDRKGRFAQAHGGTILLDEIGSMALSGQSKLLRVLQEREFEPVGSSATEGVDVRVLATTNIDLREAVDKAAFRQDLFYRLNVVSLYLPPLRERPEDIPLLAQEFLRKYTKRMGKRIFGFYPEAIEVMLRHAWPGNVRELENVIERAVVVEEGSRVHPASLALHPAAEEESATPCCGAPMSLRKQLDILEKQIVLQTLSQFNWVRKEAALELGIDPRNFNYFLRKHNISEKDRFVQSSY